jgi:hypothetical protein
LQRLEFSQRVFPGLLVDFLVFAMPQRYRRPSSFRYLRAQLRPITQPIVWAPAAILAIIVVFVWDFWINQRQFSWDFNAFRAPAGLDADSQAIGADIDNTSLLIRDFNLSAVNSPNQAKGQPGQTIPGTGANNRAPSLALLGATPQPGQLLPGNSPLGNTGSSLTGTGLLGGTSSTNPSLLPSSSNNLGLSGLTPAQNTTLPNNVLQQALTANRTAQANSTTAGNTPTPGNGLRQPLPPTNFPTLPTAPTQTTSYSTGFPSLPTQPTTPIDPATTNSAPPNSFTALTGGSSAAGVPPVPAPAAPTNNFGQSSLGQSPFNSNPFGQQQTGAATNPQAQQQLNQNPNAPISPRAPGRYLGGGQINSFSDPLGTSNAGN